MDRYWQGNGMEDMVPATKGASQCWIWVTFLGESLAIVSWTVNTADFFVDIFEALLVLETP